MPDRRWEDLEVWEQVAAKLADTGLSEEHALAWVQEVLAAERERIAQAIEALPVPGFLDAALLLHVSWRRWRDKVVRIARNGGGDE